jgi:hypothetical protein
LFKQSTGNFGQLQLLVDQRKEQKKPRRRRIKREKGVKKKENGQMETTGKKTEINGYLQL